MKRSRPRAPLLAWRLAVISLLLVACTPSVPDGGVHVVTADGVINPVMANYIARGIDQAEEAGAEAVVLRLDTPGGLDTSMREIVQRINAATVPVVVYVAPPGARAASAGTFITMAGHVAAMAPNTAIGAAHPVAAGGADLEGDAAAKAENDAAAYIRSIAEARDRNADWAERAVRESVSVSASEAVTLNVVDLQAASLEGLLNEIDGREVTLGEGLVATLQTAEAPTHENDMTFPEQLLMLIGDPNIAFLLLSIGSLALVLEVFNPSGIGAVIGALALILAFFALGTLPVNWAGVALVLLAVALFAAELFIVSGGLLGLAGVIVMALGGLFLTTSSNPQFEVSRWLAFGLPALLGAGIGVLALFLLNVRHRSVEVGGEALVGLPGVAREEVEPGAEGYVSVHGERWRARLEPAAGAPLTPGDAVVVTAVEGLRLIVRHAETASERAAADSIEAEDARRRATPEPGPEASG